MTKPLTTRAAPAKQTRARAPKTDSVALQARVDRLETTVGTLIMWVGNTLGTVSASKLLAMLRDEGIDIVVTDDNNEGGDNE